MITRYALTGATGLVGSNLLYEIIKQRLKDLESIQIIVLGRSLKCLSLKERIRAQLIRDGFPYITNDVRLQEKIKALFEDIFVFVEFDLTNDNNKIPVSIWNKLISSPIDYFYHVGANTDLRGGSVIEASLLRSNIQGTQNILKLISEFQIGLFSYVGTAYSCGEMSGKVLPDGVDLGQSFRNPYERTKLIAETIVREFALHKKINVKYFRPSVVGGRLLESPIGLVNKFDVFYGWAAFFLAMKRKVLANAQETDSTSADLNLRICYSLNGGLNIVPVDFVAKAIYLLTVNNHNGHSYHLVSRNELLHREYIPAMLETVNVTGVSHIDHVPSNMNMMETLYYRTAGKILTPYITRKPTEFFVDNYADFIQKYGVSVPVMDLEKFQKLLDYAKGHNFGLGE